jgi:hypothetical protein
MENPVGKPESKSNIIQIGLKEITLASFLL